MSTSAYMEYILKFQHVHLKFAWNVHITARTQCGGVRTEESLRQFPHDSLYFIAISFAMLMYPLNQIRFCINRTNIVSNLAATYPAAFYVTTLHVTPAINLLVGIRIQPVTTCRAHWWHRTKSNLAAYKQKPFPCRLLLCLTLHK